MIKILTSGFDNGFPDDFSMVLKLYVKSGMNLVFVASEFENIYEKTDWYCNHFLNMFSHCGITFDSVKVIDGRLSKERAQELVRDADVLWLAGGDTPTQFGYLKSYGLIPFIREHKGVVIGMSAGAINMAKTAVCTLTCGHNKQEIYEALGLVDFSVEPHFDKDNIAEELLMLSQEYTLYGICDDGVIICDETDRVFLDDIFLIDKGKVTKVSSKAIR